MQSALVLLAGTAPAVDRFGEALPEGAAQRLGTLRLRYRGIGDLGYLPDGRPVIAVGGELELWDPATGKLEARQRVGRVPIVSLMPRRDGKVLLLADSAANVLEWDLAAQKVVRQWPSGQRSLRTARYSPDETRVLTTGAQPPTLKEWDLASGKETVSITGKMHFFNEGIYGPDGKTAFVCGGAGSDPILAHYDLASGALLKEWLNDYYTHARSIALSPGGERLLVGSRHKATEWQVDGLKLLGTYTGHHGHAVTAVAYCADPDQLLTGSRDGSIRRWSRATVKVLLRWVPHDSHVSRLSVSPDGKWVLSYANGMVAETSIEDGSPRHPVERHGQGVQGVAALPGGRVVSASADATLRIWDSRSGDCLKTIGGANLGAYCVAVTADGKRAAAGCKDGVLREFDLAEGRLARERKGHTGYVRSAVYTPDGKFLLSSADDGSVRIWGDGDAPEAILQGHRGGVLSVAVSPDGALALSGGRDGTVRLWDLRKRSLMETWEGHRGWVEAVCFSPDGRFAFSGSRDGRVLKRETQTGKVVAELRHGGRVLCLAWAGRFLCVGGEEGTVSSWDGTTGARLRTFTGHIGPVTALAGLPDGKRLVSASEDTTLLVWVLGD